MALEYRQPAHRRWRAKQEVESAHKEEQEVALNAWGCLMMSLEVSTSPRVHPVRLCLQRSRLRLLLDPSPCWSSSLSLRFLLRKPGRRVRQRQREERRRRQPKRTTNPNHRRV